MRYLGSTCVLLASLAGCGCPEPVASVDTSGTVPSFSWSGGDAYQLILTGPDGAYWSTQCATGQNCFSPPVRYGEQPDGAIENLAARELDRGGYEITVCALCDDDVRCGEPSAFDIE